MRGEYYLNGHWAIEFSRATPIAGTMLYYQRGAEGDNVPETIIGRGPTTEPLVVEVPLNETFEENFGYAFSSLTNVYGGTLARYSRTNSQFNIEIYSIVFMWVIHFTRRRQNFLCLQVNRCRANQRNEEEGDEESTN